MKETVIDTILKLKDSQQTILMNTMLKYITNEGDRRKLLVYEYELIDCLQQQVKTKEADRASAVEYLSKLEAENNNLVGKLSAAQKENKSLAGENDELHKEWIKNIKTPNALVDIHKHREEELNSEICTLNARLDEVEKECQARLKKLEEEKCKLQDEVFMANQKALKLPSLESTAVQQKIRIEKLQAALEERKKMDKRMELCEVKFQELDKEKDNILEEYQKLQSQLCLEKAERKQLTENNKKTLMKLKHLEDELVIMRERKNYWEQRAKHSEEELRSLKEQSDTSKNLDNGETLALEESIEYRNKIMQLEGQVALLLKSDNGLLTAKISELEAKLRTCSGAGSEKMQESEAIEEFRREHTRMNKELELSKMEVLRLQEENVSIRNERDTLTKLVSNAKEIATRFEKMKKNYVKTLSDNKKMKGKITELNNYVGELERKGKDKAGSSVEQERNIMRLNERIWILQKDREESEKLINELLAKINNVLVVMCW
eukprot:TRINITY_DN4284_c0_g7_i1.p1 TRINITY_DN4284_c0_g7~~TRINITY_DN4284_c0_g7_i1.p1  ORF type:complete len:492 (-),score=161.39 TRINITY_DN4284_c0_g7_i1:232-1707(-)